MKRQIPYYVYQSPQWFGWLPHSQYSSDVSACLYRFDLWGLWGRGGYWYFVVVDDWGFLKVRNRSFAGIRHTVLQLPIVLLLIFIL